LSIYFKYILLGICLWFNSTLAFAQVDTDQHGIIFTIPEISILDIEPNNTPIILTFDQPNDAGNPVTSTTNGTNNTKWLNYSCSLSPSSTNKIVTVQITGGTVPTGLTLKLQAGNYTGIGQGTLGTPSGQLTLNNSVQTLISGIGASYTGTGINNGHQLTYSLSIDQYNLLDFNASATIEITYTITD
jgi:hypothetical protein